MLYSHAKKNVPTTPDLNSDIFLNQDNGLRKNEVDDQDDNDFIQELDEDFDPDQLAQDFV